MNGPPARISADCRLNSAPNHALIRPALGVPNKNTWESRFCREGVVQNGTLRDQAAHAVRGQADHLAAIEGWDRERRDKRLS